jgi:hypothetical protein
MVFLLFSFQCVLTLKRTLTETSAVSLYYYAQRNIVGSDNIFARSSSDTFSRSGVE